MTHGAGIASHGSLLVVDSEISENYLTWSNGGWGAGIQSSGLGDLHIINSTISGNYTVGSSRGGGVHVYMATAGDYDVIIIGSGIAGLYTALNISEGLRILLLTKDVLSENNSNLAQGGIAAAMEEEDFQLHMLDTLTAGCYHNAPEAVRIVVEEGRD
ncbi:MAG TPA: FAD-dependent oxidoreductase, partial [Lacipirellulaceae bacterium]|nr:FAD-dependent oxidoreductase [Lacipirellulaceae bacterium]